MKRFYPTLKRAFDVTASLVALIILSPVLLLCAILIKLDSHGPILYRSKRVGQDYKIFDLIKFRTMKTDADKQLNNLKQLNQYGHHIQVQAEEDCPFCRSLGRTCSPLRYFDDKAVCENQYFLLKEQPNTFFKFKDDPRVTPIGKFLRRSSLDELPQLVNILRGDMSLIGNRPLPLYEAEKLTTDHSAIRFISPAGLTGLWQVTRRGTNKVTEQERIELDNTYALNWSLWMDIKILFKTFPALLQKENV
ncbi:MAG: sugar transferase [Chitinophagales bacterium]|nr:sugar transferase [Chitinophagales bacterium]